MIQVRHVGREKEILISIPADTGSDTLGNGGQKAGQFLEEQRQRQFRYRQGRAQANRQADKLGNVLCESELQTGKESFKV